MHERRRQGLEEGTIFESSLSIDMTESGTILFVNRSNLQMIVKLSHTQYFIF